MKTDRENESHISESYFLIDKLSGNVFRISGNEFQMSENSFSRILGLHHENTRWAEIECKQRMPQGRIQNEWSRGGGGTQTDLEARCVIT